MCGPILKHCNAKYTTSRMRQCASTTNKKKLATGWSHDGLFKYNDFYLAIQKDRAEMGKVFNQVFLHHYFKYKEDKKNTKRKNASDSRRRDAPQTYNEVYTLNAGSDATNWTTGTSV